LDPLVNGLSKNDFFVITRTEGESKKSLKVDSNKIKDYVKD
jgi:hypothetical protein